MKANSVWINVSTTDQHQTQGLAALLAEKSVATIEAGCTGGVVAPRQGHVTLFIGASNRGFERWKPALEGLGHQLFQVGSSGCARVMKLITAILSFTQQSSFAEGLAVGTLAGLDPAMVVEAITAS